MYLFALNRVPCHSCWLQCLVSSETPGRDCRLGQRSWLFPDTQTMTTLFRFVSERRPRSLTYVRVQGRVTLLAQ